ncbi:hypothetical protein [Pseudalkalibacillus caeni]|uniref:Uncharacterized protein n=1 Tax=Exobacillus caeni TaxID=2574798 RepID=A0A5R9FDN0_9BACL|nr:hypothetical protein [Pseudalkalibacillus caeni]TLS37755.1 hypothetical protein FCL54_08005 [Pseudalkalibacillus caeni]
MDNKNHLINEYKTHSEWLIDQVKEKNARIEELKENYMYKECLIYSKGDWIEAEFIGVFQYSNVTDPSPMRCGHSGGVIAYPMAVVKVNERLVEIGLSNFKFK